MSSLIPGVSDLGGFGNIGELIQQAALLNWQKKQDADSLKTYNQITTARVAADLWDRFSNRRAIEAAQANTILAISEYVKANPKASKQELAKYVGEQIQAFALVVDKL